MAENVRFAKHKVKTTAEKAQRSAKAAQSKATNGRHAAAAATFESPLLEDLKSMSRVASPLHQKSLERAATVFQHFDASRFSTDTLPRNYVAPTMAKDVATVQTKQRALIARQLGALPETDTYNNGMTIAVPTDQPVGFRTFPEFEERGEIELSTLLTVITSKMNGTDFYARGNPLLRRLAVESDLRARARGAIEKIKAAADLADDGATAMARKGAAQGLSAKSKRQP